MIIWPTGLITKFIQKLVTPFLQKVENKVALGFNYLNILKEKIYNHSLNKSKYYKIVTVFFKIPQGLTS